MIAGQPVQLPYELFLKTSFRSGTAEFRFWASGDLSDLQTSAASIVGGQKKYDECGDRLDVFEVSLASQGAVGKPSFAERCATNDGNA